MAELVAEVPTEVAETVRARRRELGWSQDALAARMRALGMAAWHQTTVAKIERPDQGGRYRVLTLPEAVALALALGLSDVQQLLGSDSAVPPALFVHAQQRGVEEMHSAIASLREQLTRSLPSTDVDRALAAFDSVFAEGLPAIEGSVEDLKRASVRLHTAPPLTAAGLTELVASALQIELADGEGAES